MMAQQKRKVLLAVDASEQAEHAFNWYLTTVHRPDNEIVFLHVTELLDGDRNRVTYPTAGSYEEALKKEQAKIKELENKYNAKILENGISGRMRSEGGGSKPGEVICKVAEEESVSMIVVGTRCLGKVRRTIQGSVSDYVVHHAHCPVIVCRQ